MSSNKVVEKASGIIAAIENCSCEHCLQILKRGLGNQPNPADEPVPEPVIPNESQKPNV